MLITSCYLCDPYNQIIENDDKRYTSETFQRLLANTICHSTYKNKNRPKLAISLKDLKPLWYIRNTYTNMHILNLKKDKAERRNWVKQLASYVCYNDFSAGAFSKLLYNAAAKNEDFLVFGGKYITSEYLKFGSEIIVVMAENGFSYDNVNQKAVRNLYERIASELRMQGNKREFEILQTLDVSIDDDTGVKYTPIVIRAKYTD